MSRARAGLHGRADHRSVSAPPSTRSRCWPPASSRAGWPRGSSARRREHMLDAPDGPLHPVRLRPDRQIIADEFRRQHVPFVVIERDPERSAGAYSPGATSPSRPTRAARTSLTARRDRPRARPDCRGRHDAENVYTMLTARVLRPDLFIIGRAETDDAERKLLRAGANRVHLAVPDRRHADGADRAAAGRRRLRAARHQLRQPRAGDGAGADRRGRRRWPAGRSSRPTCVSGSASSSWASSARRPDGVQPARRDA